MGDDNVIPFPGAGPSADDVRAWAKDLIDQLGSPQAAISALSGFGGLDSGYARFGRRPPVLLPRRPERAAYVVRVDLDHSKPVIWRRLRLASDLTLPQVHDLLQVAMGWTDSHLHHFVMGPKTKDLTAEPFLNPFNVDEGEEGIPESEVRLDEVLSVRGDRLFYEYDFGDAWHHTIKVESVEPWPEGEPLCVCLAGRRACPPEDVGGVDGYSGVAGRPRRAHRPRRRRVDGGETGPDAARLRSGGVLGGGDERAPGDPAAARPRRLTPRNRRSPRAVRRVGRGG